MSDISLPLLHSTIAQLDQAIYNHEQWYRNLLRTLLARLPFDAPDVMPDAHRRCRFGQWYDSELPGLLREHPTFIAMGQAHEQMHKGAAVLLQRAADELAISANEFDQFNNALDRMRLEIQSLRRELVETAQNRDPLTGARNRASLISDLREQHALARRGVQQCALAMIDLDHFRELNDRHERSAGDAVLASTLQSMQAIVRPYDRIYRYGGEEFLMCMPNTSVDAALGMAERLRAAVAAQQTGHGGGPSLHVTASFGVAALDATCPVEESIDRADQAMYRAKAAGRNRVEAA